MLITLSWKPFKYPFYPDCTRPDASCLSVSKIRLITSHYRTIWVGWIRCNSYYCNMAIILKSGINRWFVGPIHPVSTVYKHHGLIMSGSPQCDVVCCIQDPSPPTHFLFKTMQGLKACVKSGFYPNGFAHNFLSVTESSVCGINDILFK